MQSPPLLASVLLFAAFGCGGLPSDALPIPAYDPDAMANAAIKQFDKNGNGILEAAELEACPALKGALTRFDANKDGAISADELKTRFHTYKALGTGAMAVVVDVKLNGRPLVDADVSFVPEECMLGAIQGGSGKTDVRGVVQLSGPGGVPGLPCGLYRITVSKKGAGALELIPAKYNANTTLGREISADPRSGDSAIHLDLK